MKRKMMIALLMAASLCTVSVPVIAQETAGTQEAAQTEEIAEAQETAVAENTEEAQPADPHASTTLSDNIYDFQLKMGEDICQFPMTYEAFTALGWQLSGVEEDESVPSNSYYMIDFEKEGLRIGAEAINLGINQTSVSQCLIGSVTVDASSSYGVDLSKMPVELAGGIQMGTSTVDDIKAAYGDPSDVYEGDYYTQMTYSKDTYERVELYVYKDDNTLKKVDVRNFSEPEDFEKGEVDTSTPDVVSEYQAPQEQGSDMLDPVVEYCGDLYQLPAPVSAFEANGWAIQDAAEDAYVEGGGLEFIDMMKNNQSVRFSIYNKTSNAVTLSNCFVTELEVGNYDSDSLSLKLSGGFTLGASKSDLIAAAQEKGYLYDEENGYLTIYESEDTKIDTRAQFWFNEDKDPDTAAAVTYKNYNLQ